MAWTQEDLNRHNARRGQPAKPSKYRNVKVVIDGKQFDSKREGAHYLLLKARQAAGEIRDLECQVAIPLYTVNISPLNQPYPVVLIQVAEYIADFTYVDVKSGVPVVCDAKGKRTPLYSLKRKWLELQQTVLIEEV